MAKFKKDAKVRWILNFEHLIQRSHSRWNCLDFGEAQCRTNPDVHFVLGIGKIRIMPKMKWKRPVSRVSRALFYIAFLSWSTRVTFSYHYYYSSQTAFNRKSASGRNWKLFWKLMSFTHIDSDSLFAFSSPSDLLFQCQPLLGIKLDLGWWWRWSWWSWSWKQCGTRTANNSTLTNS